EVRRPARAVPAVHRSARRVMLARTSPVGPALECELTGLEVGVAEYDEGPTGTTVFHFPSPVMAVIDVRGGAPGTVNTDTLRLADDAPGLSALTFARGSALGPPAAAGGAPRPPTPEADPRPPPQNPHPGGRRPVHPLSPA